MWSGLVLLAAVVAASVPARAQEAAQAPPAGLTAFRSQAQLNAFFKRLRAERPRRDRSNGLPLPPMMVAPPPPPPAPVMEAPAAPAARTADGITNNQVTGVDEGGIVKARGDILVVLRRGRLFTVSTANGGMRPVAAINAYAPGTNGQGDWYDEMLVSGDLVAVIGYSYARGGTQVNRFRLGSDGALRFVDAYSFRSQDYYSSRNYASRLIGTRLVLYAPIALDLDRPQAALPALSRWNESTRKALSKPLWSANSVFLPERLRLAGPGAITTVHSVTNCDLTAPVLDCTATSVLGSASRTFFVSGNAVYVWTGLGEPGTKSRAKSQGGASALVYRLPLNGARPQAVAARGTPVDQFSFFADAKRSALHVAVATTGGGDSLWGAEWTQGGLSLVTIPTAMFGTGGTEVPRTRYQLLPGEGGNSFRNRFVGDHLIYAMDDGGERANRVSAVSLDTRVVTPVALPHGVDRIDAIGPDAIAIGEGGGGQGARFLGFSAIELGPLPRLSDTYRLADAAEGEARSHAFFFRPDADDRTGQSGLLGLPVARQYRVARGFEPSAAIVFLRREARTLAPSGELAASRSRPRDDGCRASCVDWYGNARPIFQAGRIFALLGYELVEGRAGANGMSEVHRIDMASLVKRTRVPHP